MCSSDLDVAEAVGDLKEATGKVGDVVVAVDATGGPARGRIVIEAKDRRLSRRDALAELDRAISERSADVAILVVPSPEQVPAKMHELREYNGDKLVVAFDPDRDVAVLRVDELDLPALEHATAGEGETGAVYGHPGGGSLRAAPARVAEVVTARGTDIYRGGRIDRNVFVLAAGLAPGDSGGPLVDQRGRAVGVAFAVDPGHEGTAYALTREEVDPVLSSAGSGPVGTGPCLVG